MNQVFILWWENEGEDWDFESAHSTRESAAEEMKEQSGIYPDCEFHITTLVLKESK